MKIPRRCREPALLQYGDIGKLGQQVERLLGTFPKEQTHFVLFEDFVSRTRQSYEAVLRFLGVPTDKRTEFPRINENKIHKNRFLAEITQSRLSPNFMRKVSIVKNWFGIEKLGIRDAIREINTIKGQRPELKPAFRRELTEYYAEDIRKLSRSTKIDLSAWLDVK